MTSIPARRPTIKDVAARAGVSKSLVSLAMRGESRVSPKSRAAIMLAAEQLGYRPNAAAQNLVEQRSRAIGIAVLDLHNPISAEIIDGIQEEVRRRGFHTMLVTGNEDPEIERSELDKLLSFRVEGLILVGHRLPAGALKAISAGCPAVLVGAIASSAAHLDSISNDDFSGARVAVDHLVSLGHRRITHVTGGENDVAALRSQGYADAMAAHRLKSYVRCVPGAFTDDGGYRGTMRALSGRTRPTALFVANDIAAIGALAAASDLGLSVPRDISIVGYDGIAVAALRPLSITTIAQPLHRMGSLAAELVCARIDLPGVPPRHVRLTPTLMVRTSTAEPVR